jgi:hypothetical protein
MSRWTRLAVGACVTVVAAVGFVVTGLQWRDRVAAQRCIVTTQGLCSWCVGEYCLVGAVAANATVRCDAYGTCNTCVRADTCTSAYLHVVSIGAALIGGFAGSGVLLLCGAFCVGPAVCGKAWTRCWDCGCCCANDSLDAAIRRQARTSDLTLPAGGVLVIDRDGSEIAFMPQPTPPAPPLAAPASGREGVEGGATVLAASSAGAAPQQPAGPDTVMPAPASRRSRGGSLVALVDVAGRPAPLPTACTPGRSTGRSSIVLVSPAPGGTVTGAGCTDSRESEAP